ncbi:MAG: hypothetical protein ACK5SF_05215 [Hyphomonadaceae bacterium]|jgi:hypothetical protein
MSGGLEGKIEEALSVVEQRIEDHQSGRDAPFSSALLVQIRDELRKMAQDSQHEPKYPRFLLDWPDETGLKTILMDLAYRFSRSKGKR